MREIKFQLRQLLSHFRSKVWLAVIGVSESECVGRNSQVAAQQSSQDTTRDNEMPPIFFEMKTSCSRLLIQRKKLAKTFDGIGRLFQRYPPDVHLCG